jgi:hypothetical protein
MTDGGPPDQASVDLGQQERIRNVALREVASVGVVVETLDIVVPRHARRVREGEREIFGW